MKTIDVVIGIVIRHGKLLICQRRPDDTLGGFWEFPGGKQESFESRPQCLARELLEEVNIQVRLIEALDSFEHVYPNVRIRLHPYLCEHVNGEAQALECQQLRWIEPSELESYRFPPANERLIPQLLERIAAHRATYASQ